MAVGGSYWSSCRFARSDRSTVRCSRVGRERRDVLRLREAELLGDLTRLRFFDGADRAVRRRHGEEAVEQLEPLLVGRDLSELTCHQKVLRPAEQPGLALGDLDRQDRLRLRQVTQLLEDLVHFLGFVLADVRIGVRDAAQDVGESGEKPRAGRCERFELAHDPPDGVCVTVTGCRILFRRVAASAHTKQLENAHYHLRFVGCEGS